MNRFPFGLGCSGVAICSLMTGVLQPEKTHDTKSHCMTQILKNQTKKNQTKKPLHVHICNTNRKWACDGLLGCTVFMPLLT